MPSMPSLGNGFESPAQVAVLAAPLSPSKAEKVLFDAAFEGTSTPPAPSSPAVPAAQRSLPALPLPARGADNGTDRLLGIAESPASAHSNGHSAPPTTPQKFQEYIATKARQEVEKRQKVQEAAAAWNASFYKKREVLTAQRQAKHAEDHAELSASMKRLQGANSWQTTVHYIDFKSKRHIRDVSRMKEVLVSLANNGSSIGDGERPLLPKRKS